MDKWTLVICLLLAALLLVTMGCSGGASLSVGVGGSIHNPNHPDLAAIVRETPTISTTTSRAYAMPLLKGTK